MYDPTIGRWLSSDPIWPVDNVNPYVYVDNNPTNLTDPSGLVASFTVKEHKDYKGYPREIHDPSWIVWDTLLSGMSSPAVQSLSDAAAFILSDNKEPIRSYYDAMVSYCEKSKEFGKGWYPVPVKFRLTGLEFHEKDNRTSGPRKEKILIPAYFNGLRRGLDTESDVPVAHFNFQGYWIFKCRNDKLNKESGLFGIDTEGKARTWQHTPYDENWAKELNNAKQKWIGQQFNSIALAAGIATATAWREEALLIAPAVNAALFPDAPWNQRKFNTLKNSGVGQITSKYLEVKPGDAGADLKILKLTDPLIFGKNFVFPK